MFVAIQMPNK